MAAVKILYKAMFADEGLEYTYVVSTPTQGREHLKKSTIFSRYCT